MQYIIQGQDSVKNIGRLQGFWLSNCHRPNQDLITRALPNPAVLSQKQFFEVVSFFTVLFCLGTVLKDNRSVKWYLLTDHILDIHQITWYLEVK